MNRRDLMAPYEMPDLPMSEEMIDAMDSRADTIDGSSSSYLAIECFQAGAKVAIRQGLLAIVPQDGRPCAMEAFVAALLTAGLDAPVIKGAISAWIKGDWQAAFLPLSDDARARLKGEGGAA
ncbi:hypothetical protein [Martelella sp. AMO21009]